ncbi:histidine kinase dimerization/phosphoacceptor domain -containing protein [Frankia sp. RB7]|nr:histidine kinase dimerization/phosphoacceptor domain -containing protein [Frankia sp. RB7]
MHEVFAVQEPIETPSPLKRDELGYRLRQQSLLGEFGRTAMQTRDLREILQRATELCAIGLQAPFVKVLEYEPDDKRLMVRAGVGWVPGTIDVVSLAADMGSPAGYAYQTGVPVISNHLEADTRFRTPQLLADHGIRRAINVLIEKGGEGKAFFGVLEVDSADPGQFDQDDANFLAGFAGLLGVAIERQQADARLHEALEHQALLTREMSHRVKNSLASVVGLLRVQARSAQSEDVKNALQDASLRVSTIADVHDHLWRSSHIGYVELSDFMTELCKKLQGNIEGHSLHCHADPMLLAADHAIPLGLLINELVTNAVKYAYPDGSGDIEISAREIDGHLHVEISDHGVGLPEGFDIDQPRASLGFKVVTGMVRQLQGELTLSRDRTGTHFLLDLPILSNTHGSSST